MTFYAQKHEDMAGSGKGILPYIALFGLSFLCLSQLYWIDVPMFDLGFHVVWNKVHMESFWGGDFYVNWVKELNGGCGGAVLYYYSKLVYIVSALLIFLDGDGSGIVPLITAIILFWGVMGMYLYRIICCYMPQRIAFFTTCLCICSPATNHFFYSVNYFTYLPSLAPAMAAIWYSYQALEGKRSAWLLYCICLTLLFMTSLVGGIVFGGVVAVMTLYHIVQKRAEYRVKKALVVAMASWLLAIGLYAYQIAPILAFADETTYRDHYFSIWFSPKGSAFFSDLDAFWKNPVSVEPFSIWMAYLPCIIVWVRLWRSEKSSQLLYWGGVIVVSSFLMTSYSLWIWENVPLLYIVQIPWRLLVLYVYGVNIIIGLYISYQVKEGEYKQAIALMSVMVVGTVAYHIDNVQDFFALTNSQNHPDEVTAFMEYKLEHNYPLVPIFVHKKAAAFYQTLPQALPHQPPKACKHVIMPQDGAYDDITLHREENRLIDFSVVSKIYRTIVIGQQYYSNWRAQAGAGRSGFEIELSVEPNTGLMMMTVPPGEHRIVVEMLYRWEEKIGFAISGFCLMLLCVWAGMVYVRGRESHCVKNR